MKFDTSIGAHCIETNLSWSITIACAFFRERADGNLNRSN